MFPKWFVGLILGTINPLTIGIDAENQCVNLEKMYFFITCRYNEDNSSVKDITDFFLPEYTLV